MTTTDDDEGPGPGEGYSLGEILQHLREQRQQEVEAVGLAFRAVVGVSFTNEISDALAMLELCRDCCESNDGAGEVVAALASIDQAHQSLDNLARRLEAEAARETFNSQ